MILDDQSTPMIDLQRAGEAIANSGPKSVLK